MKSTIYLYLAPITAVLVFIGCVEIYCYICGQNICNKEFVFFLLIVVPRITIGSKGRFDLVN